MRISPQKLVAISALMGSTMSCVGEAEVATPIRCQLHAFLGHGNPVSTVTNHYRLPVVGAPDGFINLNSFTPGCDASELLENLYQFRFTVRLSDGRQVAMPLTDGFITHSAVFAEIHMGAVYSALGFDAGIPPHTDISDPITWTLEYPGTESASGSALLHIRHNSWTCDGNVSTDTTVPQSELGQLNVTVHYTPESVGARTFCISLAHPTALHGSPEANNVAALLFYAQNSEPQVSASCILDDPASCPAEQVCGTTTRCLSNNWCQRLLPGESHRFFIPPSLQAQLMPGRAFKLTVSSISSFSLHTGYGNNCGNHTITVAR